MSIRRAEPTDNHILAQLMVDVHRIHVAAQPDVFKPVAADDPELIAFYAARLADANHIIFIAEYDAQPVGYIVATIQERPESILTYAQTSLYIAEISVDPVYRGQGYGKQLIQAVLSLANERHITRVALDVWQFNTSAQAFFASQGFETFLLRMDYFSSKD